MLQVNKIIPPCKSGIIIVFLQHIQSNPSDICLYPTLKMKPIQLNLISFSY